LVNNTDYAMAQPFGKQRRYVMVQPFGEQHRYAMVQPFGEQHRVLRKRSPPQAKYCLECI